MSRKKKAQEELMKTHVLNLKEIREAEKEDKREQRRKIPKFFVIIGIILIVAGISISSVLAYIKSNQRKDIPYEKDRTKLTCISNLDDKYYKVKLHTETEYTFNNNKLQKSVSKVTNTLYGTNENLELLKRDLNGIYPADTYVDSKNGVSYKLKTLTAKEVYFEFSIDYDSFKDITKQQNLNNYSKVPMLTNKDEYNDVKKKAEKKGALCN